MRHRILLILLYSLAYQHLPRIDALVSSLPIAHPIRSSAPLHLVPISNFRDEITFLDQPGAVIDSNGCFRDESGLVYTLGLPEDQDLPELARFIVATFGADAIRVSQDFGELERLLLQPVTDIVNGYSSLVAFAEVLSGLRQRLGGRLECGASMDLSSPEFGRLSATEQMRLAARNSIVLILGRQRPESDWQIDIIGSVELRWQMNDAKIPFSLPWLDTIERRLAAYFGSGVDQTQDHVLQPYLSDLCVDERYRGKGIGRALIRCVADIAKTTWKASRLYLHVDPDNEAAFKLYRDESYKDVGLRWKPFWAGGSAEIGYFVKRLL